MLLLAVAAAVLTATVDAQQRGVKLQDLTLSLLERPTEPVFMPKGDKGIVLDVPQNYLTDKYRPQASVLKNRFKETDNTQVTVKGITVPDISALLVLPRRATFSTFVPLHRQLAARLIAIFIGMRNAEDFVSAAAYIRDRVNPGLFVYAFSVAVLHRPDTRDLHLPPLSEMFPDKFVDGGVFVRAREEANVLLDETVRSPIEIPMDYTATNLELEHRLAYFREDLGINLHHWHWHLIYPFEGPREVVAKDRRGELFYYMHQQIIARYDYERMCNKLPRVKRLQNLNDPIEEAYFPKLTSQVASRNWAGRPSGAVLRDVNREADQLKFDIAELQRWRDRIFEAIHKGRIDLPNGTTMALTERDGIDVLGNIIEPSDLSPNRQLYGNMHNLLHVAVSLVHDPDQRHLETFSVMGDSATAMRDPVFYRVHSMVNDIFTEHKNTLPRYTVQQLDFPGVRVVGVSVQTPSAEANVLETFWQKNVVDLSRGMDFNPRGSVLAKFTHLNHRDFQVTVTVENQGQARQALVRLFLAPKFDERGQQWSFVDQRNVFIELDKFIVNLKPKRNVITRESRMSSVTIPFERTFRDLELNRPPTNGSGTVQDEFNFCGCGWPQHMLIPKGSPEGYPSVIFAMVSDYTTDWDQSAANRKPGACWDAASYCGIRDQAYPDRRAMGYPFDRLPRPGVVNTEQFLTPNMIMGDVLIRFRDTVFDPFLPQQQQQQPQRPQAAQGRPPNRPQNRPQNNRPNQG
ncbi:phenoloxidase 1 [Cloeon dipterum]|uniref:phenoloxidase 1 n=1 Tax=Cloeon dipterum TaxID=197152 RepID=UPI0032204DCE